MVRQLVPLHEAAAEAYKLPREGVVTIGRRLENNIICRDISVSGKHCLVKVAQNFLEVVDCSSNGTFVNDRKLVKGQRLQIGNGDVLSLMKPFPQGGEGIGATPVPTPVPARVQFRLDVQPGDSPPDVYQQDGNARGLSLEIAPSLPPTPSAGPLQRSATTADGFAHDLLVQEQQSKAKITGELLLARRRLDEERARGESLTKELRKARAFLEEERSRRSAAQEARDRLSAEATQLRVERRQLQELRSSHDALIDQRDGVEVELTAHVQRAASLEASLEREKGDLERVKATGAQMVEEAEKMQARLQLAQAKAEREEREQAEARQTAEASQREAERLQRELCAERALREQLGDQLQLLRAEVDRAEQGEHAARELLDSASVQRGELESRAARSRGDAEAARASAQEAQGRHEAELTRIESLRVAAGRLTDGLRALVERWSRGICEDGCSDEFSHGVAAPAVAGLQQQAAPNVAAGASTGAFAAAAAATVAAAIVHEDSEVGGTQQTPNVGDSEEDTVQTAAADDAVEGTQARTVDPAPVQPQPWSIELLNHAADCSPADAAAGAAAGAAAAAPASPDRTATAALGEGTPSQPKRRRLEARH